MPLPLPADGSNVQFERRTQQEDNEKERQGLADAPKRVDVSSGWPIDWDRYRSICEALGFLGADHPIVVTQMGTIDLNEDAELDSEEVRRLYWSCIDNGYKPAKRLRIIAVGYRGERGR